MTLPKIECDLETLSKDLMELMGQLTERRQREIGWIETAYTRVNYSDPGITTEVRESTQKLAAALCVLYFCVMIEEYFPNTYTDSNDKQRNLWDEFYKYGWLSEAELYMLRAYRHVRHSFAHNPNGERAKQNATSFDKVMNSANPLPCISCQINRIVVETGASIRMVDEVHKIIQNVLNKMLSSPKFGPKP